MVIIKYNNTVAIILFIATMVFYSCADGINPESNDAWLYGNWQAINDSEYFVIHSKDSIVSFKYLSNAKEYIQWPVEYQVSSISNESTLDLKEIFKEKVLKSKSRFYKLSNTSLLYVAIKSSKFYDYDVIDNFNILLKTDSITRGNYIVPKNSEVDTIEIDITKNDINKPIIIIYPEKDWFIDCENTKKHVAENNFIQATKCIPLEQIILHNRLVRVTENDKLIYDQIIDVKTRALDTLVLYNGFNVKSPEIFKETYGVEFTGNAEYFTVKLPYM